MQQQQQQQHINPQREKGHSEQPAVVKENLSTAPESESIISQIKKAEKRKRGQDSDNAVPEVEQTHLSDDDQNKRVPDKVKKTKKKKTADQEDDQASTAKSNKSLSTNANADQKNGSVSEPDILEAVRAIMAKNESVTLKKLRQLTVKRILKSNPAMTEDEIRGQFDETLIISYNAKSHVASISL
jgi:hypothetical protein